MPRERPSLLYRKEFFRLWFEFYRLALRHPDQGVVDGLRVSEEFYRPWGDVKDVRFDDWWVHHDQLFAEQNEVLVLDGTGAPTEGTLLLSVPLNQSTTDLLKRIRVLIERAQAERVPIPTKSKKQGKSVFRPSERSEPKLRALRNLLNVYQVHASDRTLRGQRLLDAVRHSYAQRKTEKGRRGLTPSLYEVKHGAGEENAKRYLNRYLKNAEAIVRNVARGEFPGEY